MARRQHGLNSNSKTIEGRHSAANVAPSVCGALVEPRPSHLSPPGRQWRNVAVRSSWSRKCSTSKRSPLSTAIHSSLRLLKKLSHISAIALKIVGHLMCYFCGGVH